MEWNNHMESSAIMMKFIPVKHNRDHQPMKCNRTGMRVHQKNGADNGIRLGIKMDSVPGSKMGPVWGPEL